MITFRKASAMLCAALVLAILPGSAPTRADETITPGQWAFQPATDTFSPKALLDLRSLNEKIAGQSGFVKATPDGGFALGNGKSVRFWAVDEYVQDQDDDAMLAHKARWLAKRGVNMVRVHTQIAPDQPGSSITDANQKAIERVWRLVAAMKHEGIYTTISPYWGVSVTIQPSWNVPGMADQKAAALLFWDPTVQSGYKAWLKALYAPVNPHTGIPLAQDPAVAIIQLQNEDSMLFWTIQDIKGPQLAELETLYGTWLTKKYGSLAAANTAWGGEHPGPSDLQDNQGDAPDAGHMGIYIAWQWTQPVAQQSPYLQKRLADQLAFFGETMAHFNTEMTDYLRQDLGCKQLINAGNWRPADPIKLFDVERYSYLPDEVMGVNRYFTGLHDGPDVGWAIRPGDHFTNASVLQDPRGMPTNIKQVAGHPFIIPETEWVAPNGYQSEGPFLTAAYESLTGVDISYFFADGDVAEWQPPFSAAPWNPPTGKWSIATPMQLGQFPAAALLYRNGYVQQGKPVVQEQRALDDLWQRRSSLITEEGGFDPNRDTGDLPARSAVKTGVNPLAFLVGPVEVSYGGDSAKSTALSLKPYIDSTNKIVKSDTGQIILNTKRGICTINAPQVQGASGFLSQAGLITLRDISLKSGNPYATVSVVSLDGHPLKASHKILVQVGTMARPTDWQDKDATWQDSDKKTLSGKQVISTGKNPWAITNTEVTLTVKNPALTHATVLDANGMPTGKIAGTHSANGLTIKLPREALYVILQ